MIIITLKYKYINLYLPNIDDITLKNLNTSDNLSVNWPDSIFDISPIFPWIICYESEDKYWIHQNLNNLKGYSQPYYQISPRFLDKISKSVQVFPISCISSII